MVNGSNGGNDKMQRIGWIDTWKGIAILLVVIGHVCQWRFPISGWWLSKTIYSFHMPLFLFLSGLFAYKAIEAVERKEACLFVKKKAQQLLIPFLSWSILWMLFTRTPIEYFLQGGYIYWYLPTLFEFLLLFCLLRIINVSLIKGTVAFLLLLLSSVLLLYVIPQNCIVGSILRINYTAYFYVFFILGYLFFCCKSYIYNVLTTFFINTPPMYFQIGMMHLLRVKGNHL